MALKVNGGHRDVTPGKLELTTDRHAIPHPWFPEVGCVPQPLPSDVNQERPGDLA
jgi:hypothetical protein